MNPARRIAAELDEAGVEVCQIGTPRGGPQVITYGIRPSSGTMQLALKQGVRLQAALGLASPPRLSIGRDGWLHIEAPRKDRRTVALAGMRARGLAVDIGIAPNGQRVTLDFTDTPHALVAGQTGSGKSVALRAIARGLALHPEAVELVLVDLDGDTWEPLQRAAALRHKPSDTPLEARRALADAQAAMQDSERDRPIVCMVDEAQLLDDPSAQIARDIAQRGRKAGVHLVLATQYVRGDVLDRKLTDQLSARLVGRMQDASAGRWAGASDAHILTGHGDMIAAFGGRETRVQVAFAPSDAPEWAEIPQAPPRPTPGPAEPELEIPRDALIWCESRLVLEGDIPGINRIAQRFGIGNTKATRWQEEARDALSRHPIPAQGGRIIEFRRAG